VATSRDYQESLIKRLKDPKEAAAYLDAALEYGARPAITDSYLPVVSSITENGTELLYCSTSCIPAVVSLRVLIVTTPLAVPADSNLKSN
jgi:hypothetical protein